MQAVLDRPTMKMSDIAKIRERLEQVPSTTPVKIIFSGEGVALSVEFQGKFEISVNIQDDSCFLSVSNLAFDPFHKGLINAFSENEIQPFKELASWIDSQM